jgi:hypothetical protein
MNNDIMQRAMFAMPLSPEAQNSGIMSGFMDQEEPMSPEDEALEEMPVMARTPQNPEILMNNLRGDMRSLDARYVELAQMVGEQAAMETPPEVLAMLMGQMGAQAGAGIGALPQAQQMMPPGMDQGMGAPGGMEQGTPPMDPAMMQQGMPDQGMQGAPMMPPGMEGMGPFPLGGAEQAPPQQFARGGEARVRVPEGSAWSNMFTEEGRLRPITDEEIQNMPFQPTIGGMVMPTKSIAGALLSGGEKAGRGASALNQYLGNRLMAPQFTTQAMKGPGGQQLVGQARESLRMLPGGQIAQGTGTKLAPMSTLGPMQSPTLTQGLSQGFQNLVPSAAGRTGLGMAGVAGGVAGIGSMLDDRPITEEDMAALQGSGLADRIPGQEAPATLADIGMPAQEGAAPAADQYVAPTVADTIAARQEAPAADDTKDFIDRVTEQAKKRTKGDRIRERYDEISPLYKEILGDDADARKQQALLLLAEAGFKFASTAKPTMGMALASALSGVPAGLSALAAQKADREAKIKSAALSQAVEDIGAEDASARQLQLEMLKGDYRLLQEQAKRGGNVKLTDGGAGLRVAENKDGSFLGYSIDPEDPTVKRAVTSRFTLTPNNPFVVSLGQAPQAPETDKGERIKLTTALRDLDDTLSLIEGAKTDLAGAYGPGAWYSNFENNMLVPVTPLRPNVADAKAKSSIDIRLNRIKGNLARVNNSGRVSVQEQQWIDEILPAKAGTFFQDPEVNAARFNALQALVQTQRQQVLAQLGYVTDELVMQAPALGTKNDPFALPADEQGQANMLRFLGGTLGRVENPNALVYIRTPDGVVRPFKASELRASIGGQ